MFKNEQLFEDAKEFLNLGVESMVETDIFGTKYGVYVKDAPKQKDSMFVNGKEFFAETPEQVIEDHIFNTFKFTADKVIIDITVCEKTVTTIIDISRLNYAKGVQTIIRRLQDGVDDEGNKVKNLVKITETFVNTCGNYQVEVSTVTRASVAEFDYLSQLNQYDGNFDEGVQLYIKDMIDVDKAYLVYIGPETMI